MKKFAVLVILILCYTGIIPIAAETPEVRDAQLAGENDVKGFQWKWFGISYITANTSFSLCAGGLFFLDSYFSSLINDRFDHSMTPVCCLTTLGAYALIPPVISYIYPGSPPPDRFLGKSLDWIDAYSEAYRKRKRRNNVLSSGTGCFLGGAVLAGTLTILDNILWGTIGD